MTGSRHIVTAKMLHDILLQTKCSNLKMLLKHNVTNTVCYRQKMLLPEWYSYKKTYLHLIWYIYIYTQEWQLPVVQNVIMKMRIAETEMKM